jgi:Flp pilus assembly protein TadD
MLLLVLGISISQAAAQSPDPQFVPEIAREAAGEGNTAFRNQEYEKARRAYTKVLELAPDNLLALTNLGVVEFADGKSAEAEKLLKRAVQIRIENAPAWLTLGILYMDQGRLDESLAALTQSLAQDSGNPRARNYLGVVIGRKGWYDGAQSELRKAVEIDPNYSDAHFNLAYFYLERKPPLIELARRHYFRSIELGAPPDPDIEAVLKKAPPKD